MSAVAVRQPGSRILHDTVLDPITHRPITRCSERPVAVVWLSVASAASRSRAQCANCAHVKEVGALRRRSWWVPSDPKPVAATS